MASVSESIDTLRAALQKIRVESSVQDAFDSLASCLVLLNSSSPSVQMMQKLRSVLRKPFLPLYNTCFQPALQLSSRVLSVVLGKLCDAHIIEDEILREAWDVTADVILSGILDFLDQRNSIVEPEGADWEVLYRIICEFFFLDSGRGLPTAFSTTLCLSAYNTLTEIAARQTTVRNAFRQRDVLGGERLGAAISGTRYYLLLEALLTLFARLLPPTHVTSQGKSRRFKFAKEVLGSTKLFKCSAELLDIMQKTVIHWDDVAAKIIDALAKTDITYPQPFSVDEIHVCGRIFPQPLATDRLIMDKHAFLVNIVAENNDTCESLQMPYSRVRTITLDNSEKNIPKGKVSIIVYLTAAPLIANVEMKDTSASTLHAKFLLQSDAVARFMEALRRRGVGKLSFLNPLGRADGKRRNISIGSGFRFTNNSSPIPPTASFEGKVQHVNQVYKTDIEDPTTHGDATLFHPGNTHSSPTSGAKPLFGDETLVLKESAAIEDVLVTQRARLIPPINEGSKPLRNSAMPFLLEESRKRTDRLFDDVNELSELSDIEFDGSAASERAESRASATCSDGVKPTQHGTERMRTNNESNVSSSGSKTYPESTLKNPEVTEGVTQRTPDARKPLLISGSSMFGPSSSTRIDVSPKLASNADTHFTTVDSEVVDDLSGASLVFVGPDDGYDIFEKELDARAGKHQESSGLHPTKGKLGQRIRHLPPASDTDQKGRSPIDLTKDTNVPPKIAGNRRKRESVRISSKPAIEAGDECSAPRKKRREDKPAIEEDRVKSNETLFGTVPTSKVKGYMKTVKRSSPVALTAVNSDEPAELKPALQGSRRSSRIRKKQTAATGGTRGNATRGKTQKGKQADDTCVEVDHGTVSIFNSHPIPPTMKDTSATEIDNEVPPVQPKVTRSISLGAILPPETPKGSSNPARAPSQHIITPDKESRENLDCIHEVASHATQEQFPIQVEEFKDLPMRTEASQPPEVDEYSVTLNETEEHVEPSPPIMESTPRNERVTIDLTIDESPARDKGRLRKPPATPVHPEAIVQMKLRTPEQSENTGTDPPVSVPTPRRRSRIVTFASPIEYVLEKKVKSRANVCSPSTPPLETHTLSPLRVPAKTVGMRREPSGPVTARPPLQNLKRLQASESVPDQNVDDVNIQDIVEVLNEIQAVIIKGISTKFKNIKIDVQHSRDELIQQVLEELRGMVIENAKYFNGLLHLEEDYHKHCSALTRCWEELIDCNDSLAVKFQNALKEHDKNVSARVFPKSLLNLQPVLSGRCVNA